MSVMPPPPGGDQPGYESAPQYQQQGYPGGMPAPVPASAPASILRAKYAMYAGAALQLVGIVLAFFNRDAARTQIEKAMEDQGLPYTESTIDAAMTLGLAVGVGIGLIGVVLWLLIAWLTGKGKGWARIVATVLFVLFVFSFLSSFLQPTPMPTLVLNALVLVAGGAAVFFLWQKPSTQWFQAHKAPRI